MAVTRTDTHQEFRNGVPVKSSTEVVDVTVDAVLFDLASKARKALAANTTYLALGSPNAAQVSAQVNRLTRECSALIRLLGQNIPGLADLMLDNAAT